MSNYGAIPTMVYKDANSAIEFLINALGFEEYAVFRGENKAVEHAQLKLGKAMIMLSTYNSDSPFGKMICTPKDVNNLNTQSVYIIIDDVDKHYQNAKANGAKIVMDIKDEDYGGRGYSCKDPEGFIWSFGSYNPFAEDN